MALNFRLLAGDALFGPGTDLFVEAWPNEFLETSRCVVLTPGCA